VSPILCSDSTFLHLDATAWTALAVIVALALGLYGAFWPPVAAWFRRPRLRLDVERLAKHSELSNDCSQFILRLPVSNRKGQRAGTEIEVFLESVQEQDGARRVQLPTYLPVRLLWCHGHSAVCDRIPGAAYRLLDLGYVISEPGKYDPTTDTADQTDVNELVFQTEISNKFKVGLPLGSYKVEFLITSASTAHRQSVSVSVRSEYLRKKLPLSDYIDVRPA